MLKQILCFFLQGWKFNWLVGKLLGVISTLIVIIGYGDNLKVNFQSNIADFGHWMWDVEYECTIILTQ